MTLRNFAERMVNRTDVKWIIEYTYLTDSYGDKWIGYKVTGCSAGEDILINTPDEILDMYEIKSFGLSLKNNTMHVSVSSYDLIEYEKERLGK